MRAEVLVYVPEGRGKGSIYSMLAYHILELLLQGCFFSSFLARLLWHNLLERVIPPKMFVGGWLVQE